MTNTISWLREDFILVSDCNRFRISEVIPHGTWAISNNPAKPPVAEFSTQIGAIDLAEKLRAHPDLPIDEILQMDLIQQPIPSAQVEARDAEFEALRLAHDGA